MNIRYVLDRKKCDNVGYEAPFGKINIYETYMQILDAKLWSLSAKCFAENVFMCQDATAQQVVTAF